MGKKRGQKRRKSINCCSKTFSLCNICFIFASFHVTSMQLSKWKKKPKKSKKNYIILNFVVAVWQCEFVALKHSCRENAKESNTLKLSLETERTYNTQHLCVFPHSLSLSILFYFLDAKTQTTQPSIQQWLFRKTIFYTLCDWGNIFIVLFSNNFMCKAKLVSVQSQNYSVFFQLASNMATNHTKVRCTLYRCERNFFSLYAHIKHHYCTDFGQNKKTHKKKRKEIYICKQQTKNVKCVCDAANAVVIY